MNLDLNTYTYVCIIGSDIQSGVASAARAEPVGAGRDDEQPEPEPDAEPEPAADAGAEPDPAVVAEGQVLFGGQLEEGVGHGPLAQHLRGPLRLEVHPVPPPRRLPRHGLLRLHRQGRRRDPQVQHGPHSPPRLPQHHHLDPQQDQARLRRPLRRQPQFPQGIYIYI